MSAPAPVTGDRFDQYELSELVARSGMAAIFKARDTLTGATVALKVPHFQSDGDDAFSERFRREEELGYCLEHPHLVRILRPRRKSCSYLAMEYVEGASLRAVMGGRPLPVGRALDLARQICEVLEYLHSRGVLHRDVKPENVLVTPDGQVKIIDLGIALVQGEHHPAWNEVPEAVGTPDYMAPEQIRGEAGDARTDVYALGLLLYELLTGRLPYEGATARASMRAKMREEPIPPSARIAGFDPHLEAILLKAIARAPRDRYPSAAAMLVDLRDPASVPPLEPGRAAARRRRRRWWTVASAAAGLALLAGAAALTRIRCRPPGSTGLYSPRPAPHPVPRSAPGGHR